MSLFAAKTDPQLLVRMSVMESQFEELQRYMSSHMVNEEEAFCEMKDTLKEIRNLITETNKEHDRTLEEFYQRLLVTVDKDYASKLHLEQTLTGYRSSLSREIASERARTTKELWVVVSAFAAALTLCGWLYANVVKH